MKTSSPTDMAFVADALLALAGQDAGSPFRLEGEQRDRERKLAARARFESEDALGRVASKAGGSTFAGECIDAVAACGLTDRQREVFDLMVSGLTFVEIGGLLSMTRQGAMNVFVQALKKVRRTVCAYPYLGLGDCYRDDVRRRGRARR